MTDNTTTKIVSKNRISAYVLDERGAEFSCGVEGTQPRHTFTAVRFCHVHTPDQIRQAAFESGGHGVWIATTGRMVAKFIKALAFEHRRFDGLLVLDRLNTATCLAAGNLFRHVAVTDHPESFLPREELLEVLAADNRADLFIGGTVDHDSEVVVLIRGDLSTLVVPMRVFAASGDGVDPDFRDFSVIDYGHTLRFGKYEASSDAVLYEIDPAYRRRLEATRKATEKGFGPALRRLRKQRGLKRSDFAPLNEKTIARIERGEVEKPQGETLEILAAKLRVPPDEIESY